MLTNWPGPMSASRRWRLIWVERLKVLIDEIAIRHFWPKSPWVRSALCCAMRARLSRHCTDWYPLLDLCAYNHCLIADRDGVYDATTPNGRLLLGMKGIVSEIELYPLRGRLIAGVQQKAQGGVL